MPGQPRREKTTFLPRACSKAEGRSEQRAQKLPALSPGSLQTAVAGGAPAPARRCLRRPARSPAGQPPVCAAALGAASQPPQRPAGPAPAARQLPPASRLRCRRLWRQAAARRRPAAWRAALVRPALWPAPPRCSWPGKSSRHGLSQLQSVGAFALTETNHAYFTA